MTLNYTLHRVGNGRIFRKAVEKLRSRVSRIKVLSSVGATMQNDAHVNRRAVPFLYTLCTALWIGNIDLSPTEHTHALRDNWLLHRLRELPYVEGGPSGSSRGGKISQLTSRRDATGKRQSEVMHETSFEAI